MATSRSDHAALLQNADAEILQFMQGLRKVRHSIPLSALCLAGGGGHQGGLLTCSTSRWAS